jgi:hypothetical protein
MAARRPHEQVVFLLAGFSRRAVPDTELPRMRIDSASGRNGRGAKFGGYLGCGTGRGRVLRVTDRMPANLMMPDTVFHWWFS